MRRPKKKHQDQVFTFRLSTEALERLRHNAEIDRKNISKYLRDKIDEIPQCPSHPTTCPHCGKDWSDKSIACSGCGYRFENEGRKE